MKLQLIFLVCVVLISCKDNNETLDCSAVACQALNYQIKLIDKNTKDNIILTKQFTVNDISITNDNNEKVEIIILDGVLIVYPKNNINGNHKLNFTDSLIEYSYEFLEEGTNCCDFGNLRNVNVIKNEYVVNENLLEIYLNL